MNTTLRQFEGMRASTTGSALQQQQPSLRASRVAFRVVAQKKVAKKEQVVLTRDISGLGQTGELKSVAVGYFRNFLLPQGMASVATKDVLTEIRAKAEAKTAAANAEVQKAQALATALKTIGKFIIKKKVGEGDQIFGSVTPQEVADAINMQTGRMLDKRSIELPEIKTTGTFEASVQLHAQVVGYFKVIVQKEAGPSK